MSMLRYEIARSEAQRLEVLEVAYHAFGWTQPLSWYQAQRLPSRRRALADWWIARIGDRAVSTLLCYPLLFEGPEGPIEGFGFGSVTTLPECQGRGYSTALQRHVIAVQEASKAKIGLLFSRLAPAFYERLGFRPIPCWAFQTDDLARIAQGGPRARMTPIDPYRHLSLLQRAWRRHHRGLHLRREETDWRLNLLTHGDSLFFATEDGGYVRVAREEKDLWIQELCCGDREGVIRAVAELGRGIGAAALKLWHEPLPLLEEAFRPLSRKETLPMVRGAATLEGAAFHLTDYF